MTLEPDYKFGLLSLEDEEKLERILCERSQGAYGGPRLHGMLTASVVGPAPVPLDFIVQTVLNGPDSEQDGFDDFPEFSWLEEKAGELFLGIVTVLQQDPEMFCLFVDRTKPEGDDTTPDPRSWCLGFVEGMMYHRKDWQPLLSMALPVIGPIFMTVDPHGWGKNNELNVYKKMTPSKLCEKLQTATQAIHAFWSFYHKYSDLIPAPTAPTRAPVVPGRNQPCPCHSGLKFKHCCGRLFE